MSQIFPLHEQGELSSGVSESVVPGLQNQLLLKTLHNNLCEQEILN